MIIGRAIGWIFVFAGFVTLGWDLRGWRIAGHWRPLALGQVWYRLDRSSLNLFQAGVQRHLAPFLWNDVIAHILLFWLFATLIVIGALLVLLFRRRERRQSPLNRLPFSERQ